MNTITVFFTTALTLFTTITQIAAPLELSDNQHIRIPVICEMIHERTYFILRLEKLITLLKAAEEKGLQPFQTINSSLFNHDRIKSVANHINETHSLTEFFSLWDEIIEFRHIKDKELVRDFAKLNLALLKQLSLHTYSKKIDFNGIYRQEDEIYEIVYSLDSLSFTEALTVRNYYANRLKKALDFLTTIRCRKNIAFESDPSKIDCSCAFDSHYTFKNKEIIRCIKNINKTNKLTSVITLGQEFAKYKLIQDNSFTKEFTLFIFCLYKNIINNNATIYHASLTKSTIEMIAHLYENLEDLPLEEILDALDILSEELPKLLEKYEFTSKMNWQQWLAKYWWVPPVIGSSLAIRILLHKHMPNHAPHQGHL